MMRHQRRTTRGPVSDVALRGRSTGHLTPQQCSLYPRMPVLFCAWRGQENEARQYFKALITTAEQIIKLAGSTGGSRQEPWTASLHIAAVVAC
jgi:hypothetical protein